MIDKSQDAIVLENVSVHYGDTAALQSASLRIPHGTLFGVIGMNGAGKSTLFKVAMGLVKPTSGTVEVCGRTPQAAQKIGCIAYAPQSELVDWDFPVSVFDVVMMGRYGTQNVFRSPRAEDIEHVEMALRRVEMLAYRDRQIGELSGGQKKRVFIARSLAQGAEVMILDEPFAGLDATREKALTELLLSLKQEGKTIILATHELTSLSDYCDHVALIKKTVLAYGPTREVFTRDLVSQTFDGIVHRIKFD